MLGPWLMALAVAVEPTPAHPTPPDPVAVMPFKNLNSETSLEWLRLGIAETMVSDLRRSTAVRVVERDQIDRALAEISLQGAVGSEEATAARVGRLVGAKTIVLGSFQRAEKELRINARFVTVETGVVLDAAKTTGKLTDVFALQDQIVDRLLGRAPKARPPRKATPKSVDAYRLFALSLATSSAAERVDYLKRSVAIDPDFVYALDDLAALEKRMAGYAQVSTARLVEQEQKLFAQVHDVSANGEDRARAAVTLLTSLSSGRRFNSLVEVATAIYESDLSSQVVVSPREYAAFCRVLALHQLKKWDLALQYGEQFLAEFPTGVYFSAVKNLMSSIIDTRKQREAARPVYEARIREQQEHYRDKNGELHRARQLDYDLTPCTAGGWTSFADEHVLDACRAFVAKYEGSAEPRAKEQLVVARYNVVQCLVERGQFAEARTRAEELLQETTPFETSLKGLIATWPTD